MILPYSVNLPFMKNRFGKNSSLNRSLMFSKQVYCCLLLVLGLLINTSASADEGKQAFDRGIKASTSGDYTAALKSFKKAKQAGMNTHALKYNLAVSYYKLQQYETARIIFTELTDVATFEQIAYFNLGLIANKQKDEATAIRWFQRAHRDLSSEKVRTLAAVALKRLGVSTKKSQKSNQEWKGWVSSSLAHVDNVTLINNDLDGATNESDSSVSLWATAGRWLKGNTKSGVRMKLNARTNNFSKMNDFDESAFGVRVLRYDRLGSWKVRMGGSWDEIYFGGSEYQRVVSADVRGRMPLSQNNQLQLRYKLSRIQATDAVFDYLDGWRQQFRVGIQQRHEAGKTRYYYQLELNDREDRVGTVDPFTSYSPTRHTVRLTNWWDLANQWRVRLGVRFRYSDYNDDNILAGNVSESREDSQARIQARISRAVGKEWEVGAKVVAATNDSTVDRKSYDTSTVAVGVVWSF